MATQIWVNNCSNNGLLPGGTRLLTQSVLTHYHSFQWHSQEGNSLGNTPDIIIKNELTITFLKVLPHLPWASEFNSKAYLVVWCISSWSPYPLPLMYQVFLISIFLKTNPVDTWMKVTGNMFFHCANHCTILFCYFYFHHWFFMQ